MGRKKSERLAPKSETLRELYLKSGNQCAFPGCSSLMINKDGVFVGNLCHIEAAESGGERFNSGLSPEERRAFENLMLMCYEHHTVTNDVVQYTVEILRKMKAAHEANFTEPAKAIQNAITDHSMAKNPHIPKTLRRLMGLEHKLDENQIEETVKEVKWAADQVQKLPIPTRQILCVIIGRLRRKQLAKKNYKYEEQIYLKEVCDACQLSVWDVKGHIRMMEKYGIAREDDNDPNGIRIDLIPTPNSGWFIWGDLQEFCTKEGLPLKDVLVDLRFDLMD